MNRIPETVDWSAIIEALKDRGWLDAQIEAECEMNGGYLAQVRGGFVKTMRYRRGALLYNLWVRECGQ